MNMSQMIQEQAELFARRVREEDPSAEVKIVPSKIQQLVSHPFSTPVADLVVRTGDGRSFEYILVYRNHNQQFETLPTLGIV